MRNLAAVYRPTRLDDVVGQDSAKKVLREHLKTRPSSGYLFVGSAGTGKTTHTKHSSRNAAPLFGGHDTPR